MCQKVANESEDLSDDQTNWAYETHQSNNLMRKDWYVDPYQAT